MKRGTKDGLVALGVGGAVVTLMVWLERRKAAAAHVGGELAVASAPARGAYR